MTTCCPGCAAPDCSEFATGECHIACQVVPESACDSCVPTCGSWDGGVGERFGAAARDMVVDTTSARYTMACFTYFIYAVCIVLIDIYSFGGYVSASETRLQAPSQWQARRVGIGGSNGPPRAKAVH
jgi:hypothetical protein